MFSEKMLKKIEDRKLGIRLSKKDKEGKSNPTVYHIVGYFNNNLLNLHTYNNRSLLNIKIGLENSLIVKEFCDNIHLGIFSAGTECILHSRAVKPYDDINIKNINRCLKLMYNKPHLNDNSYFIIEDAYHPMNKTNKIDVKIFNNKITKSEKTNNADIYHKNIIIEELKSDIEKCELELNLLKDEKLKNKYEIVEKENELIFLTKRFKEKINNNVVQDKNNNEVKINTINPVYINPIVLFDNGMLEFFKNFKTEEEIYQENNKKDLLHQHKIMLQLFELVILDLWNTKNNIVENIIKNDDEKQKKFNDSMSSIELFLEQNFNDINNLEITHKEIFDILIKLEF